MAGGEKGKGIYDTGYRFEESSRPENVAQRVMNQGWTSAH